MIKFLRKTTSGFLSLLVFIAMMCFSNQASATHICGADITYRWVSGNSFEVTLTLYRDCSGIAAPVFPTITYSSASCGYSLSATLSPLNGTGQEITRACSTAATVCSGGTIPGIQQWQYRGIVTLPAQCTDWVFGYSICCRNCAITTLSFANCNLVPGMSVQATLNNVVAPTNSSPVFTSIPVTFVCTGQPFIYNQGTTDANGDSVVYSFVTPRNENGNNVVFNPGFSTTNPISSSPAISIDPGSGTVTMTPTATEVGVMAILVSEYRNGVLIGSVVRDMQLWTQPCNNVFPAASGINGSNTFEMVACPGRPISFTVNSTDANSGQNVSMIWNNGIPGATFNISGGPRPVGTFNWTPSFAQAGNQTYVFTVTVFDDNCPIRGYQTFSYSITIPPITVTPTTTPSACATPGTGSATAIPNATAPVTYSWSPGGSTSPTINNLTPGFYTVTITDGNGCTTSSIAVVNGPNPLAASINGISNVSCASLSNGSASVAVSGGTAPYNYNWSSGGGNSASVSNLAAGNYTVTITDFRGCIQTASVTITAPPPVTAAISSTNVACNGEANGSATVNAGGGVGSYSYQWSPSGSNAATISGLIPGSYTVTVTDANGCTTETITNIIQPLALSSASSSIAATCGVANGSASVNASGGTAPFSYLWTPGNSTSNSISNIPGGSYSVLITDANGCTITDAVGVSNTGGPTISVQSTTNVSCNGGSNGAASVNASGNGTLTYQWNPSGGSGLSASNLAAGSYTVTVRDANNCVSSVPVDILEPLPLYLTPVMTDVLCNGQNTGSAGVIASGGTAPYIYLWNNGSTASSLNNLTAGNYSVTITDVNGCTSTQAMTISQPSALTSLVTSTPVSCFNGNNGSASVDINGGTIPYSYSWSGGLGNASLVGGLTAGTYTLTATDANNCTISVPVTIQQPALLNPVIGPVTPIRCNGGSDGSASVSVSGGTAPFTYLWSPSGGTGTTASSLGLGNYTVAVEDANGCSASVSVTIAQPPPLTVAVVGPTNVSCFGGNDGAASVNPTGGVSPYTYSWSPSVSSTASANGLSAGTYSVTITDVNGCTQPVVISVNQPAQVTPTVLSSTNVTCNGGNDGAATIDVTGGTGNFSYVWSPAGGNGLTAGGLAAGTYTVIATDDNGCSATTSVSITEPTPILLNTTVTPSTCGYANGSASVSGSGGSGLFFYSWDNGSGGSLISNVVAGSYSVTATDGAGCTTISSATISDIPGPTASIQSSSDVSCYNGSNGSAIASPVGGTAPFNYVWSPASSSLSSISNLIAGNYSVTITDANNCTATASVTITQPDPLLLTTANTSSTCGFSNGAASVTGSGGTGSYSYIWSNGALNGSISNVVAGNYSVTVTDINGCSSSAAIVVSDIPGPLASIPGSTDVTCFNGNNGAAFAVATGGTAPFSYSWSSSASSTDSLTNAAAGTYIVTITDANTCTSTATVTITQPLAVQLITAGTPSTCGYANGSASVSGSGGTGLITYSWSSGSTGTSLSNVNAGNYLVTGTDANGCTASSSVAITDIAGPVASIQSTTPVSCFNGNDGGAVAIANGGTSPFTFSWTNASSTTSTLSNVIAGNYNVTIADANNCLSTASVTITQPPLLTAAINASTDILCYGGNNGSASVQPTGGTAPFTYLWNPSGATGNVATGLTAGAYLTTITDANGCTAQASVTLTEPTALAAATNSVAGTCNISNGTATVTASGGTGPYTYSWQNGTLSATATGLAAGTYSVTIMDANGCTFTTTAGVTNNGLFALSQNSVTPVSCFNRNDGAASVSTTGGLTPFSYNWSPSGGNSAMAAGLAAGTYIVTVTDGYNCVQTVSITVTQPPLLTTVSSVLSNVQCFNGSDGSASITPAGGTAPYSYSWNPGGWNSSSVSTLSNGSYSVLVTDNNGCTASTTLSISQPMAIALTGTSTPAGCNQSNGTATVNATGGTSPYSYSWSAGSQTSATAVNVSAGSYLVTVTDANQCSSTLSVGVSNYGGPSLTVNSVSPVSCYGGNNGSASINVINGTSPYSYQWSPSGGSASAAVNLPAGNYTVAVTDANNCISTIPLTVSQPLGLNGLTAVVPANCNGSADGSASIAVSGGVAPYTYLWSSGSSGSSVSGLNAGTYTVTVTDANTCSYTSSVQIIEPAAILISSSANPVTCAGGNNGSLMATASGGAGSFSYSWSNGATTALASSLSAGSYLVTATDLNGCTATTSATVSEPNPILLQLSSTATSCFGNNTGTATVNASGGNGSYTYLWTPGGQISATATALASGNYSVVVTDVSGCSTTSGITVSDNSGITPSAQTTDVHCFNGSDGSATISATGGNPPFQFTWSTGTIGSSVSGLVAGNYSVTITDANGCSSIAGVNILQPSLLTSYVDPVPQLCIGQPATLSASANGGTPPYQFTWNNGVVSPSQTITALSNSSFNVVVTDANGCITSPQTLNITLFPPLSVIASVPDTICRGESLSLSAIASGGNGGPYTYSWSSGVTGSNVTVTPDSSGLFTVTVRDNCGTPFAQADVPVSVLPVPLINVDNIGAEGCVPLLVHFEPDGQVSGTTYLWTFGDGTSSTDPAPYHEYTQAGNYNIGLTVQTPQGCSARTSVAGGVNVYPLPIARFEADPLETTIYESTINFTDASVNAAQWAWDFGDSTGTSSLKNPAYTYTDTGSFLVRLIALTNHGCPDTAYQWIKVEGEFAIYIPNAFTPNNDNVNDLFLPRGVGISKAEMWIFDRWGLNIFHSENISKGWDGHLNDNPCQADVYVYKIKAYDMKEKEHRFIGHVTLVR